MNGDMLIDGHSNTELEARYAELVDANPEPASTEVQVRACVAGCPSSCSSRCAANSYKSSSSDLAPSNSYPAGGHIGPAHRAAHWSGVPGCGSPCRRRGGR